MSQHGFFHGIDELLDEMLAGESIEACLQRYSVHRAELEPLLRAVDIARQADAVPTRLPEAIARAKTDFLSKAASARLQASEPDHPAGEQGVLPQEAPSGRSDRLQP